MTDLLMPQLSDSMVEGTVLSWLAEAGDEITQGQDLVEIETDKATMTHQAEGSGTLAIVVAAGETVAVGEVIARVGDGAPSPAPAAQTSEPDSEPEPEPEPDPDPAPAAEAAPLQPISGNGGAIAATPLARRIAHAHGVALEQVRGSGPRGRVVRSDVMAAAGLEVAQPPAPVPAAPSAAPPASAAPADERVEPTRLQALIARRMTHAKSTIPEFQVQTDVEMTAALAFRAELKRAAADAAPSLNDLIVKASALALRDHPRANGSYVDDGFVLHGAVDVGVAVAASDALVVPVLRDADHRTLGAIAAETRRLAEAVRTGSVTPAELEGGTFTVSNLGMYGMTAITPVINPPQAAILGVGAVREVLARDEDGAIVDRRLLTLTLSCDHRILYGADAARFLAAIRARLEAPATLAL